LIDLQHRSREQVREQLEQTYQLPLNSMVNQGKWMFVPALKGSIPSSASLKVSEEEVKQVIGV